MRAAGDVRGGCGREGLGQGWSTPKNLDEGQTRRRRKRRRNIVTHTLLRV